MPYLGNSPGVSSQRVVSTFTATSNQTTFTPISGYTLGYIDVYLNGIKLVDGDDYTAANGMTVVLASGAAVGDSVECVAFFPRGLSDGYLKSEADAKYLTIANPSYTGTLTGGTGAINIGSGQFVKDSSGKVGLGTASPATPLHVYGAYNEMIRLEASSTSYDAAIRLFQNGTQITNLQGGAGVIGGGTLLSTVTNAPLILATSNTERIRIDGSGNVGLGGYSSAHRLLVRYGVNGTNPAESVGGFVLGDDATFTEGILRVKNAGNRGTRNHANGSGLFNFEFSDAAGMSMDKAGNLFVGKTGINTNSGLYYAPAVYGSGIGLMQLAAYSNSANHTAMQFYSNLDFTYKFYVQWNGDTYIAGKLNLAQPANTKNEIMVGSVPSWGTSDKTFFTAVGEYGYSNQGLILQCGYDTGGDVGGMKITDDGICMWGAGDEDLLRIYNEDSNVLALQIADNNNAVFSGSVTPNSDETLKTNWRPVCDDFVEQLANLRHGIYDRTDMTEKDGTPYTQVGVGAQSLQAFFPEGVYRSKTTDLLGVDYGGVSMVSVVQLAKKVVEQQAIIEQLRADVQALKEAA